ncbi:MAG TPA: choice-of-anchor B family protein [Phycisphaerales bacterium]|nr:choice-of-anchor B family protein [Phycisphaerales bacterium]
MIRTLLIAGAIITPLLPLNESNAQSFAPTYAKGKLQINSKQNKTGIDRSLGFTFDNVILKSWLDLGAFGNPSNGNDCWGYTSPSGREYAIMGLYNKVSIVEVTSPTNPIIIGSITHSGSLWADIKVYQDVAYVSNESSGGIDIIDLANVDSGVVSLVQRLTTGGISSAHNIAVDETSGFLYIVAGNTNGGRLVAFDLTDPRYPTLAGSQSNSPSFHDAQIITYTSGPYAGRQICFGFAGGSGLYIVDVTNKSNMFTVSQTTYSGLNYCHQGWVGPNNEYVYLNDELDYIATTRVIQITDINNPVMVGDFGWGVNSIDHNLYIKGNILYEANYTSGLRVFDLAVDPVNPPMIAFYDTYPENNSANFNGLWSCFPYFDSGTIIGSDIERGLFVWEIGIPDPCNDPLGACADDIDGDGIIGVGDVLSIIENWGVCGDGTFRPTGDIDGSCCVDVSDLLQLVGVWDSECIITGACCASDGSCTELSPANCAAIAGYYAGDSTTCATTNCPGAGDECNNAVVAQLGPNNFDTSSATPSSPAPDESQCSGTYMNWNNSPDVWFIWEAEFSGDALITTCDSSSYDTSMAVYEDTCSNQIACNGDATGNGNNCQSYYSEVSVPVTLGNTYYIRIGGWQGATGTGTLTIQ